MVRTCPSCGAVTAAEVRFCRHCGASLKAVAVGENEQISPLAQTVPLSNEGLTTSSLGADDPGGIAPETKRVHRVEMERLLSHTRFENTPGSGKDGDGSSGSSNAAVSDYAAPQTGELARPVVIDGGPAAATRSSAPAPASNRSRRSWALMAGLLLLATLSGALVAYYFLRQRPTQNASEATVSSNSNQAIEATSAALPVEEANANAVVPPQAEETPRTGETPRPQPSIEPSRDARVAKQERERETQARVEPALTPTPVAAISPDAQATPTPQPTPVQTPSPSVANRNTAQAGSDEFYFQAVNLVNGRDPRSLQRAELVRALQLFLNVKSGPHLAEAGRQAERLGKELDHRRKQ
jgi:hypothetical protein